MKKLMLLLSLFILVSCNKPKEPEPSMEDYVSLCAIAEFTNTYADREIILTHTEQIDTYYLTDLYYRIEFENGVYKTEYISAINTNNELVIKEIQN